MDENNFPLMMYFEVCICKQVPSLPPYISRSHSAHAKKIDDDDDDDDDADDADRTKKGCDIAWRTD